MREFHRLAIGSVSPRHTAQGRHVSGLAPVRERSSLRHRALATFIDVRPTDYVTELAGVLDTCRDLVAVLICLATCKAPMVRLSTPTKDRPRVAAALPGYRGAGKCHRARRGTPPIAPTRPPTGGPGSDPRAVRRVDRGAVPAGAAARGPVAGDARALGHRPRRRRRRRRGAAAMGKAKEKAYEYHEQFAARIIKSLEEGTAPWQSPGSSAAGRATRPVAQPAGVSRGGRCAGSRLLEAARSPRRGGGEGAQEAHAHEPLQRSAAVARRPARSLDATVAAAYGWSADISDDEVLRELPALNVGGR